MYLPDFQGASLTAAMKAFEGSVTYAGAVDFSAYVILFCLMLIILDRDLYRLTKLFKKGKSYFGILAGVGMVFLSAIYGMIIQATGLKGTNDNQSIINRACCRVAQSFRFWFSLF
jgi:hypothetical protein